MSRRGFKSMRLILPGFFLLVLGAGNIAVGTFKGQQYDEVLAELAVLEPGPVVVNASPLRRIQFARQTQTRLYQRQNKARARRDFYDLVEYGGKVFITISGILLCAGMFVHLFELSRQRRGALPEDPGSGAGPVDELPQANTDSDSGKKRFESQLSL